MLFHDYLNEQLKDPKFRKSYERLGVDYKFQMAMALEHLRISLGLTQQGFADLVGVKQPHVARSEGGSVVPSIGYLLRVAKATGTELVVRFQKPKRTRTR